MNINKGTHKEYRTDLFMPIMKSAEGDYIAVLSDNSTDRDEESISKGCIEKMGVDNSYLAALCNHDNNVFMQVAEWTNKGVVEVDGFTALIAEPRFFVKSSPQARQIKGMLDEGAKIGISIGAMVKEYDEIDGKRLFTELELVEASFVAVPSNRHGRAMAVAKSFNKNKQVKPEMEKEFTQKDIDSAVEKKVEEVKTDFEKQLETKDADITKLKSDLKKSEEETAAAKEETAEAETKTEEAEAKIEEANAESEKAKKAALEKQKIADDEGMTSGNKKASLSEEEVEKAYKDGKLPVMQMER